MSKERIAKIKKKQTALEIIYPEVKRGKVRNQLMVYFTRSLIPLTDEFANGTVFFSGIHEYELKKENPDLIPEQNYNYIDVYRAFNFVHNTQGLNKIMEILQKTSIKMN
jgi:hypothetical protein